MAFNAQEQAIIQFGIQNGKSRADVEKALFNYRNGIITQPKPVSEPTLVQRLSSDINRAGSDIVNTLQSNGDNSFLGNVSKGFKTTATAFNVIPQVATEVLPKPAREVLGKIGETIGKGFEATTNTLADTGLIKGATGNQIINPDGTVSYIQNQIGLEKPLDIMSSAGQIAGDILLADQIVKTSQFALDKTAQNLNKIPENLKPLVEETKQKLANITSEQPAQIMNRVARLKPTDYNKFEQLAGKTPGEYLVETGNFGTPEQIISREATKWRASMNAVDTALEKLPGIYKDVSVEEALKGLLQKAQTESSGTIKPPYYNDVVNLISKYNAGGLEMADINLVKRLFERNVKLGYNKLINGTEVAKATYIDNALRNWQLQTASKLGFKNISELNKQTQLSRFIANKLGEQIVGQSGLNGLNLTDWIMLSGGDVSSISGFLTKKFFSSKAVQAKVAELLNQGKITPDIQAILNPTQENLFRQVSPQGLQQLNAPVEGIPQQSINTPINQPSARAINSGTEIVPRPTGEMQISKQPIKKVVVSSPKITTESSLIQEAKKYKSAEDFISKYKGSATQYGDYTPEIRKFGLGKGSFRITDKGIDPNLEVTIYRGVPDTKTKIVDGDFVTVDRMSAESYAGRDNVISKKVKAKDLIYDDPSNFDPKDPFFTGAEFVYSDSKNPIINLSESELKKIWQQANK